MNKKFLSQIVIILLSLNCQAQVRNYYTIEKELEDLHTTPPKFPKENNTLLKFANLRKMEKLISNSFLESYKLITFNGTEVVLGEQHRQSVLLVSGHVNTITLAQLPALNKIAEEHKGKIQFFMLYNPTTKHDSIFKKYADLVYFVPVDHAESNKTNLSIKSLNYLGIPTTYFLDKKRHIVGLYSGGMVPGFTFTEPSGETKKYTEAEAIEINYTNLKKKLQLFLDK